jgi:DegV family protein with EDD domain
MNNIGIVTEEAVDLPVEITKKHGISIVPVRLNWPELENMAGNNTFQKMRELEKRGIISFGKTSQPSPMDFANKYSDSLKRFKKILCITLTSKLSGSNNSANQAVQLLSPEDQERIYIVDSLSGSCGQALVILKAIDLIKEGKHIEEIAKELEVYTANVYLFIMFENPTWVETSGRISHTIANLMRGMAKIHIRPVLTFRKGTLHLASLKARSKDIPSSLFKQLHTSIVKLRMGNTGIRVAITHGDYIEGAEKLQDMIEKNIENVDVVSLNILNNVVGALTGPNTLAVAWSKI